MDKDISLQPTNINKSQHANKAKIKSQLISFIKSKSNIIMILILILKLIIFSLFCANYPNKAIIICDPIYFGIILIGFALMVYKRDWSLWIHWTLYVVAYILILIISILINKNKDNAEKNVKEKEDFDLYVNYIFFNVYIQNSFFIIGYDYYRLGKIKKIVHFAVWVVLTIGLLFVVNFIFGFRYETITFSYCFLFGLLGKFHKNIICPFETNTELNINDHNTNAHIVKGKDKQMNPSYLCDCCCSGTGIGSGSCGLINFPYESTPSFYGSCIVNEHLLIKCKNSFFNAKMKDICVKKAIQYSNLKDNDDNKSLQNRKDFQHCSSSQLIRPELINQRSPISKANTAIGVFINGDNILMREEEEEQNNGEAASQSRLNLREAFYFKFVFLLKSISHQYKSNEELKDKFIELGKFKYLSIQKERRLYEVYCRALPFNASINNCNGNENDKEHYNCNSNSHEQLYELAFYELTDNLKRIKIKIEKKYKTLLLRKINHEFKVPIVLIQNMINEINEVSDSLLVKSIVKTIKYVTDTILLLVSDLTEYIHLNTMAVENKEVKSASGCVAIYSLYQDIQNICFVYTKVFNKNVSIQFEINEMLKSGKVIINENKLKQILSTLITNAIKNSSQILISFGLKEKEKKKQLVLKSLNSIQSQLQPQCPSIDLNIINNSPKNNNNGNGNAGISQSNLSPRVIRLEPDTNNNNTSQEYDIVILIEDNGPGIDQKIINSIKAAFNFNDSTHPNPNGTGTANPNENNTLSSDLLPMITFNSYKNQKGLGSGIMIAIKLCKDLNISLNCDLIGTETKPQGTRFSLYLSKDITIEDAKNDSCIYEYNTETSNSNSSSPSEMTQEVFIESFHYGDNKGNGNDNKGQSHKKRKPLEARKSRTCLFYRLRYGCTLGEPFCISPIQVINFTINAVIHPKPECKKKMAQRYSDIPLFNDSDFDCSFHNKYDSNNNERYINYNSDFHNQILLTPTKGPRDTQPNINIVKSHFNTNKKLIEKKSTFNSTNIAKLKGIKNLMRSGSTKGISLFHKNSKKAPIGKMKNYQEKDRDREKDIDLKSDFCSNNMSIDNDKSAIVIVDDIDSNKKAIYSLVKKQLQKSNKVDLYDFELLSDGIELINLFYHYQFNGRKIKMIICDESMNYMNGSEAFAIINKVCMSKSIKTVPFILCSAFSDNGFKEQMVSNGIKTVYEKPLQSSTIDRIIQEFEL